MKGELRQDGEEEEEKEKDDDQMYQNKQAICESDVDSHFMSAGGRETLLQ